MGNRVRIGVGICVHNEEDYIEYCLRSIYDFADAIAVSINTGVPWGGKPEPLDRTEYIVRSFPDPAGKLRIQTGEWNSEMDQRSDCFEMLRNEATYYMTVDGDEMYTRRDLRNLRRFITLRPWVGQFRVRMRTYWKIKPVYVIDPPEPYKRYLISRYRPSTKLVGFSMTNERFRCMIPQRVAVCHHFSYARTDLRIKQKLDNTSHRDELVAGWYENVWLNWDSNHSLEDLHPTHPSEYKRAIPVNIDDLPEEMREHPYVVASCR